MLFALGGVQELLAEPLWVLAQAHMFVRLKVVSESLAMIAKCSITVVMVVFAREWGLYIFSVAHVRNKQFLLFYRSIAGYKINFLNVFFFSQCVYTGFLVLCYTVYFIRFLGSKEATENSFPLHHLGELLPYRIEGEVKKGSTVCYSVLNTGFFTTRLMSLFTMDCSHLLLSVASDWLEPCPAHLELL